MIITADQAKEFTTDILLDWWGQAMDLGDADQAVVFAVELAVRSQK